ncbi:MAG: hypothetical protein ACRDNI_07945 [Gaiellaceae bacterium]
MHDAIPDAVSVAPGTIRMRWLNHPFASGRRAPRGFTVGGRLSTLMSTLDETVKSSMFVTRHVNSMPFVSVSTVFASQPTVRLIPTGSE